MNRHESWPRVASTCMSGRAPVGAGGLYTLGFGIQRYGHLLKVLSGPRVQLIVLQHAYALRFLKIKKSKRAASRIPAFRVVSKTYIYLKLSASLNFDFELTANVY